MIQTADLCIYMKIFKLSRREGCPLPSEGHDILDLQALLIIGALGKGELCWQHCWGKPNNGASCLCWDTLCEQEEFVLFKQKVFLKSILKR